MSWTAGILFLSWFCIVSVTEAALGTSCNAIADPSNCAATESCTNSMCVCSDGYFDVSGNCVTNSISVTLQADSTSIVYGSSVVLTATITSAVPVDTVLWQKEEMNIDINQEKYTQSDVVSNVVTLSITNLVTNDGGSYRVQVNNSAGTISDWSIPVTLTVTGVEPTVTVPGTITETDTTVTIHCTASVSQGSPALTAVYWLFKGEHLSSSESNKYSGGNLNTQSLTINSIGPTDAGEYRCVATNLVGSTTSSQSVNLAPPSNVAVNQQPSSSIIHGSKVTFTGSYSSTPLNVKDIKWQKQSGSGYINIDINGNVKYYGSRVTGSSPKLIINPVQFIDETSYQLVVSNGVGSASSFFSLSIENGQLTVTIGPGVNGRIGRSVTIKCNVNGPEPSKVQWIKYINGNQVNIIIDGSKYSGGATNSPNLIINSLHVTDAAQYECTASNKRGNVRSASNATVTVNYGQFNEDCSNTEPCDSSKKLKCTSNKCLCMNTYYHKEEVCYEQKRLEPINIYLNSTTSSFFVFWSPPNTDSELVSEYEVKWRVLGTAGQTSGRLSKSENTYNVSNGLISGQLYIVNVISHVSLTSPTKQIPVVSPDTTVRTIPLAPGPIKNESHFAHNNLQIKWTVPVNTVVTKYEVTIDGTTYTTMSNDTMYQFTGKVFVAGESYVISIVTVSGTTSDIVKKSSEHTEWIRTTPTKLNPPTNLQCPQSPLDISLETLEISWKAPENPNGLLYRYQINVSPGNLQIYTSSNETHKNVEGLSPEQMYTFTVHTINDAVNNTSEPSQPLTCTTKAGVSSAPRNLNIDEIQSRGFRIQFNRPDNVSDILAAYKIVISEGGNCVQQILVHGICSICKSTGGCPSPINYTVPDITNSDVSFTVTGLDPYSYYVVKVVAINGEGEGHPVNETVRTNEEVPLRPGQITASNVQSSSLTLAWTLPDQSPGNTTYTIYTYEGIDDIGTSFLMKASTKVFGFETKMLLVTGLEEYWPYKFKVNAATVKGNTTSDFSSVFKTKQAVIKDDETTSTSSIIGSVVAVILVVAVVVIGIFLWKRNRRHKEYKERANTYADLKLDERTKLDQPYSLLEHGSRTVNSKSVPLNSFYDYVVDLLNNSRQKLTKEYHDLLQDTERSALTVASSKDNVSKNRGNIIPYDSNRVRLCSPGASDYINASVLLDKCYILTSYPITKTFGNFWQMVWEQNVSTIVVMTGHSDDRESWYFSDNEGTVRTMERIDVELLAKFKSSESVTMRKIKLSRGKHSKVVNHFHVISLEMTDLPDQILALINTITQNNVKNTGPQVVHGGCTGVDNSGVYIAVDHAVKSVVSGGNEIDVYGTARAVMKERMFSISSLEQYSAIYTCLQKYVQNSPACKNDATGTYEYLP